jgi:hypothetical protein
MTDNEVSAAFQAAALDSSRPGHTAARRLSFREHFKVVYQRNPEDLNKNPQSGTAIFRACKEKFGADCFRHDVYVQKGAAYDFPVLWRDGTSVSSLALSKTLQAIPVVAIDYVFVSREKQTEVEKWIAENKATIIKQGKVVEDE